MYPSSWQKRGAENNLLWALNFWRRMKYFLGVGGGGWGLYCQGDWGYFMFFCIDAHTHYPCLSVRGFDIREGWYPCGFYTGYISHCHIYRKIIFAKYLLGWQEWLIKQPRKQNKAGGKMIGKKFIKEGGKYRKRGYKKRALEALCRVWLCSVVHN